MHNVVMRCVICVALVAIYLAPLNTRTAHAAYSLIDNASSQITYGGAWTHFSAGTYPKARNQTVSHTSTIGAWAEVTFQGWSITYRYTQAYNRGNIKLSIDGIVIEQFSGNTPEIRWQVAKTFRTTPSPATHTIRIEFMGGGTYMDLDAFEVSIPVNLDGKYDSANTNELNQSGNYIKLLLLVHIMVIEHQ